MGTRNFSSNSKIALDNSLDLFKYTLAVANPSFEPSPHLQKPVVLLCLAFSNFKRIIRSVVCSQ